MSLEVLLGREEGLEVGRESRGGDRLCSGAGTGEVFVSVDVERRGEEP
jgi:hypothetical protein